MTQKFKTDAPFAKYNKVLVGGRLAVNFANLKRAGLNEDASEQDFTRVVNFLAENGVVPSGSKAALFNLWTGAPAESAEFLEKARVLSGALRIVFEARAAGEEIQADWVEAINEILTFTEGHDRLEPVADREVDQAEWRLALHARAEGLEWLLTAIARNGAELIAEGPRAPIRKCANPNCGLFFYDDSRTGKRHWCSMARCGNRAKVAAHYRREKNKR
ncbi:MAG TPA: CGNR zinc finger domain-containing protein [Candidatus Acidoferrum sp.]|nr:CGNR zinc finger domain-containing protein [Candidatus Acidoferrum sp.]